LPLEEVATLVRISLRTLARRKREGKFNFDESERLFRLTTVLDRALELFEGDEAAARRWLQKRRPIFDNQSALELAKSEIGAGEVKDLIGRLEHGVFT
jgi:putative toxin-antitoxin system antitoxin component (TIGR02293 family)